MVFYREKESKTFRESITFREDQIRERQKKEQ